MGLNCSRDVECRYWVDSRKQWEREGCLMVDPPNGKFDGFLHCECYMAGMFAGIVFPWVIPPPPIIYDIFANADILQNLPAINLPFNVQLILTLVVLVSFNVLSLGWAKFRVHRRTTIQQRANDARRRLSRMSFVSNALGDDPGPQYVPPTKGALKFVGQKAKQSGGETAPKNTLGTGDMLMAVVLAAQRKAQSLPSESIQERVPIAALVEASRTSEAVFAEGALADRLESPPASRMVTPLDSRPGKQLTLENVDTPRRHSISPRCRTLVRPNDADNQMSGRRHSWSPAETDGPPPPVTSFGTGMVQQRFSMVPLSALEGPQRTRIEMVREQQVFLAMREQQVCGPAAGTQPPPHLPRILQNRIPNLSPQAGTLLGVVSRRGFASNSVLPAISNTPSNPRGIPSRYSSVVAPGAGYVSPYAQPPCRGAPNAASAVRQQISSGRLPLPTSLTGGPVSVPREDNTSALARARAGPMATAPAAMLMLPSPPTSPPEEDAITPPSTQQSQVHTSHLTQSRVACQSRVARPPEGAYSGRWWCSTGEEGQAGREAIRDIVQTEFDPSASAVPPSGSAPAARSGREPAMGHASAPPARRGGGPAAARASISNSRPPPVSVLPSTGSPDVDEMSPTPQRTKHAGWCRDSPQWTRCNAMPGEPTGKSPSGAPAIGSPELSPEPGHPLAFASFTPAHVLDSRSSLNADHTALLEQPTNPPEPADRPPTEAAHAPASARAATPPSSRGLTPSSSSRRLSSLAAQDCELAAGSSEAPTSTAVPRQGTETPPRWVQRLSEGSYGEGAPITGNYRTCRTPPYLGTPRSGSRPRTPDDAACLIASTAQLGLGSGCALTRDEMGDEDVERAVTPISLRGAGLGEVHAAGPGRHASPYRSDIPTQTCAMAPSSWFAPADGTEGTDGAAAASPTAMRSSSTPAIRKDSNDVPQQRRASAGYRDCDGGGGCAAEEGSMRPAPASAPDNATPFRMAMRSRVSMTASKEDEDSTHIDSLSGSPGTRRTSASCISGRFFQKKGGQDNVSATLHADSQGGPKGGRKGLAVLAKLQAAGRTVTNTIKVKQIFVPPPAPPPPTMWATIKNEHLLVATFWSADANYAKVQKGQSQLRETQLVQIVFNTLMFQLGLLSLLAWRFTDFETVLTGPMIFAAGTLAAFLSAAFTLLCKGVFRWGNTRRRKARKASRLHRLKQWVRLAAKEEGGIRVAVMKEWWHYRTSSLRRTSKQALPRMAVVVRQNVSWLLIFVAYFASLALVLVFGLSIEDVKYHSVLGGWAVSLGETWLLVEPSVVFIMIILPRFLDEAMTPVSAMTRDEKAAKVSVKLTRKRKRASILLRQLEAPFNSQHNSLPLRGPAALISAVLKPKKSSSKYAH